MDWTCTFDGYVAGALALGSLAGALAVVLLWLWGGLSLLRRGWVRAAIFLTYALAWGVGLARRPGIGLLLSVMWLSSEVVVPRVRAALGKSDARLDVTAASAAVAGAAACLGALWLGPLGQAPSAVVTVLGAVFVLLGLPLGSTVSAVCSCRRWFVSPVSRAAVGASLTLAFDGLYLAPGGLTVFVLGIPMLIQLAVACAAALGGRFAVGARRLAAASVWLLALTGLVAFSRFNLSLSKQRSEAVIAACRSYEHDHGQLPPSLSALVPRYLPRVPRADWTTRGAFQYTAGQKPELSYFAPWPLQVVYSFDTGERRLRSSSSAVPHHDRDKARTSGRQRGPVYAVSHGPAPRTPGTSLGRGPAGA
jgi:hypothetical protein